MISSYGGGLAWFTVFCLLIFVVSVLLNEVHRKGSEIEEKAQPTQYDFLPGIFTELVQMINNKYQHYARTIIYKIDGKTPEAPLLTPGMISTTWQRLSNGKSP
jgi:beta-galactosidase GanA